MESPDTRPPGMPARIRLFARVLRGRWRLKCAVLARGPLRIVVGSGGLTQPDWIATDVEFLDLLDPPMWTEYFKDASIAAILAEHVWEHLTLEQGSIAARTCHRFLAPGGWLRIAVPDGFHPDPGYREQVRVGGSGAGAHDHKVLYDHHSLARLLVEAGFEVDLLEFFDATGKFHSRDWNPADGLVRRSRRFDERNHDGQLRYTSLIVDARKQPAGTA